MKPAVSTLVLTLLFALAASAARAQQLDEKQMLGRQVFASPAASAISSPCSA